MKRQQDVCVKCVAKYIVTLWSGLQQELMSAAKRCEGASNYRTLFVPSSVESRALNLAENAPYKVSSMFAPTSLRRQQVAIITAGGLLGIHISHSSNLKAH